MPSSFPKYVLLSDAPPLKEGGYGCHVLAWKFTQLLGENLKLVVTRRHSPELSRKKIEMDLAVGTFFYPDLSGLSLPRFFSGIKNLLELIQFYFVVSRLVHVIHGSGAERVFALFGANPWFLAIVWMVKRRCKLPVDVYLVDDLEESSAKQGHQILAKVTRWFEPKVLRKSNRVFAISDGMVEHLRWKYNVDSRWLPIPISAEGFRYSPLIESGNTRTITFLGAVNFLYVDALKNLLEAIRAWNEENPPFFLKLTIMTYTDREYIREELGSGKELEVLFCRSSVECRQRMEQSWFVFVPYSYADESRLMVTTSFPSKLAECWGVGRPLLIYGPSYASLPRYFQRENLPLCVVSSAGLREALSLIPSIDGPALIENYERVARRNHSTEAIATLLKSDT